jgi:hypothetical protein
VNPPLKLNLLCAWLSFHLLTRTIEKTQIERERERERERVEKEKREREREIERESEQKQKNRDRERDKETKKHRDRERGRERKRERVIDWGTCEVDHKTPSHPQVSNARMALEGIYQLLRGIEVID